MSYSVAFSAIVAALTAPVLFAQNSPVQPRDLYLEKISGDSAAAPARHHLGVRYTELLVDPPTRRVREVDPDTVFHQGDCIAVEFTPNRNGAVYVLNHGSSGDWQLLIPNALLPDASGPAQAGVALRVPTDYCFRLDDKPGIEILMVAITEYQEDVAKLRDLLAEPRPASGAAEAVVSTARANPVNVDAIRAEVESWQRVASRDLKLEKIASSVYAVMSASAAANRLVVEIRIRHE
jgi:hypothetical protein